MKQTKPYGSWPSRLSADLLASQGKRFGHMQLDNGALYWLEVRAAEKGRGVIVKSEPNNLCQEVLPAEVSVRTKVHEYGGGDFLVKDDVVYYSDAKDNRIYQFKDGKVSPVTAEESNETRFADFDIHPDGQFLVAVRERHKNSEVINDLVAIDIETCKINVLHSGQDFYSFPRFSPQGHRICWTSWNQPDMPWDATELWLGDWHDGKVDALHLVTGGKGVSIFQPSWDKNGDLHYVSDKSGWANIYSHKGGILNALTPTDHDFSVPQWVFGMGTYAIHSSGQIYALYFEQGQQQLCHIDENTGHIEPVALPFKHFEGQLLIDADNLYFSAAGPATEMAMFRFNLKSQKYTALSEVSPFVLSDGEISIAESIRFDSNGRNCHAFYYPPKSNQYQAVSDTKPPLIVMSHGGPTGATNNALSPGIQFWTNRGFAVVDVNYAGSTGFGKAYQKLLDGQWGVYDVEDCVNAATYLVEKGLANPDGLFIRGGSAGGYTTLCALTFFDSFTAGMSRYGVSDLEALAAECHKFEGRYTDNMVGPLPDAKDIYVARSPIHHTDKLSRPILLLQGSDDKVVPPNQAEMMVEALEAKKIPHAYILFEGEGHGFRNAKTIVTAFNAELSFYRQMLGVESDEVDTLEIKYLEK